MFSVLGNTSSAGAAGLCFASGSSGQFPTIPSDRTVPYVGSKQTCTLLHVDDEMSSETTFCTPTNEEA